MTDFPPPLFDIGPSLRHGRPDSPTSFEMPSGTFVELMGPHPDDIFLEDIAHNLANTIRFGGSCICEWSVAEHAVMGARELRRRGVHPVTVLRFLHHDDPEAYLLDIPRPFKRVLGGFYKAYEDMFWSVIQQALGLDIQCPDGAMMRGSDLEVTSADEWALGIEAATLMTSKGEGWCGPAHEHNRDPDALLRAHLKIEAVRCIGLHDKRQQFLDEHERCMHDAKEAAANGAK